MTPIGLERSFTSQTIQSHDKEQPTSFYNKENISTPPTLKKRKASTLGIQTLGRRNLENSYSSKIYFTPQRITENERQPPLQEVEYENAKQMRKLVSVKRLKSRRRLVFDNIKSLSLDSSNPLSSSTTTSLPFPGQAFHSQKFPPIHWNTTIINPELAATTKKMRKLAPQQSNQEPPHLKLFPSQFQINSELNIQTDDSTLHSSDVEPPKPPPVELSSPRTILNFMRSPTPPSRPETSSTIETLLPTLKISSKKEQPSVIIPEKISLSALQIPPRGRKESEIVPIK